MKFVTILTAIILLISNFTHTNHVYASTVGTKPTIESMSVNIKEATVGDTVNINVKIKEYVQYGYLNIYYSSPITGNGITIQLNLNTETMSFEGSFPISNNIESGNYTPNMLSLYGDDITSINSSEYENFGNGAFVVNGTAGTEFIESINVDKKEVTVGDTVNLSLKTSSHLGINYMNSYFRSPITNQTFTVSLYYNPESNTFEGKIPISSISEAGTYKLFMLNTYEEGNNTTAFYSSYYGDKFQYGDFTVSGTNDTNLIESITLDKNEVTIGETINFAIKMPELVGINYINIYYSSPVTNKSFHINLYHNSETALFEGSLLVPNSFELGNYSLFMLGIYDSSGNITALYSSDYVEFEKGNFTFFKEQNPPSFANLTIDKNSVKPGDSVRINVAATDDTILLGAIIDYIAPASKNIYSVALSYDSNTRSFIGDFPITESSEVGIWKVDSIEIKDTNENSTLINANELDLSSGEFRVEDVTAPSIPSVDEVTDKSTSVLGTAEAGSTITVKTGELVLGKGTTTNEGKYSVTISLQNAGTILSVTATDNSGNVSEVNNVTVIDVTAPQAPTVDEVTDKSTNVTGTAEVGSTIIVKVGTTIIGNATTNTDGKYVVSILTQKVGTKLIVSTKDKAGNMSEITEVIVIDITPPTPPIVNEVTDTSTSVTGTGETGTTISIIEGTTVLATGITAADGSFSITIPKQRAGNKLTITATDDAGNVSVAEEVTVVDITAPIIPTVNEVTDKSTSVRGTAEVGSLIKIKSGTTEIGSGTVGSEGTYIVQIAQQKAGTKLLVTATDTTGNTSGIREVTIVDVTAPTMPTVNEVTDQSTSVTGTAEVGSLITIKSGTVEKGSDTVDSTGKYSVLIELQKAGTILTITATDTAKNSSDPIEVTVTDAAAPLIPTVNEVTDKSTSVSGTAEVGSLIKIKSGTTEIGSGTVDSEGIYTVQITQQKAGTKLAVTATDTAGNTSGNREVTVVDVTAPTMSTVNEVTDQSTSVTGNAEAGSSITIKVGTTILGTGTTTT
uniref:Ig-like domain-containing protein n=1 Tax=Paenisporosarcina sp. TG20 TaxID=1211706 RepID=UPI0003758267